MFGGKLFGRGARAAGHANEPPPLRGGDCTRMETRDGARADESESHFRVGAFAHFASLVTSADALARNTEPTQGPEGLIWPSAQPPSGLAPGINAADDSRMSATDQLR